MHSSVVAFSLVYGIIYIELQYGLNARSVYITPHGYITSTEVERGTLSRVTACYLQSLGTDYNFVLFVSRMSVPFLLHFFNY